MVKMRLPFINSCFCLPQKHLPSPCATFIGNMLNNLHVKKQKTKHDHFYVGDEVPLSGEPQVGTQGLDTGHVNATEATFSKSPPSIRKNTFAGFFYGDTNDFLL